jgi:hypothetical protein
VATKPKSLERVHTARGAQQTLSGDRSGHHQVVCAPAARADEITKDHPRPRAMMRAWVPGFANATATSSRPSPSSARLLAICLEEN